MHCRTINHVIQLIKSPRHIHTCTALQQASTLCAVQLSMPSPISTIFRGPTCSRTTFWFRTSILLDRIPPRQKGSSHRYSRMSHVRDLVYNRDWCCLLVGIEWREERVLSQVRPVRLWKSSWGWTVGRWWMACSRVGNTSWHGSEANAQAIMPGRR